MLASDTKLDNRTSIRSRSYATTRSYTQAPLYARTGWPVLGVLPELSRNPTKFLDGLMAKYGSVVPVKIGPHRVVVAGHPDAVHQICVLNADNYEKTRFVEKLKPILGNGLATSNGHIWEQSRRVIQPAMTHGQVQRMLGTMDRVITDAIDRWPTDSFDIGHASCDLTLRVLSATMFGTSDPDASARVVASIDTIQDYISKSIWSVTEWRQRLNTQSYRKFTAEMARIWDQVTDMIATRRAGEKQDDLLQALIDAVDPTTGQAFDQQQIIDEVMTVFMAGHDTTGNTLAFVWNALASDPDLQAKVREEVLAAIPLDRTPSFADISKLTLTNSLLKEVLRLYPSSWWFARTAIADDTVMGIRVRAGDTVMVAPYVTHRLPDYWPDALRFDPYRFIDQKPTHKFSYIPFGAGPRMCPGSHFATAEMLLAIARLVQRRELRKTRELECEALVTLRPKDGLSMQAAPWSQIVTVAGKRPGDHAVVDAMLRLRKRVFADEKGWQLTIDEDGREIDQFDDEDAEYSALIRSGAIAAYGRMRSTEKPSLLFDVYPTLVDPGPVSRGAHIWEGTRLGTSPDVPARERTRLLGQLIGHTMRQKRGDGAEYFCSVSDTAMEKVLRRLGLRVHRLGNERVDRHGFKAMGLLIELTGGDAS
jgi:cytochrome P450/N-acyl-L-homoserine lactone synthetase